MSIVPSRSHYGYLPYEGRFPNNKTENYVNKEQIKAINLKPVKRIQFLVDPLHPRSGSIRQLMTLITNEKVSRTGPKTAITHKFVSDRSEPTVTLTFHDDAELKVSYFFLFQDFCPWFLIRKAIWYVPNCRIVEFTNIT